MGKTREPGGSQGKGGSRFRRQTGCKPTRPGQCGGTLVHPGLISCATYGPPSTSRYVPGCGPQNTDTHTHAETMRSKGQRCASVSAEHVHAMVDDALGSTPGTTHTKKKAALMSCPRPSRLWSGSGWQQGPAAAPVALVLRNEAASMRMILLQAPCASLCCV